MSIITKYMSYKGNLIFTQQNIYTAEGCIAFDEFTINVYNFPHLAPPHVDYKINLTNFEDLENGVNVLGVDHKYFKVFLENKVLPLKFQISANTEMFLNCVKDVLDVPHYLVITIDDSKFRLKVKAFEIDITKAFVIFDVINYEVLNKGSVNIDIIKDE